MHLPLTKVEAQQLAQQLAASADVSRRFRRLHQALPAEVLELQRSNYAE